MQTRRWGLFIGLNIVVSVLTTLAVLTFKGERTVVVTATPAATAITHIPTAIPAGQGTVPTASLAADQPASTANEYVVQAGDTLGGISMVLDVSLEDLLQVNDLTEDSIIRPGDVLVVPADDAPAPAPVEPGAPPPADTPAPPTPFPTETPTPPGPVQVRIQELLAPGELEREGVVIINRGRTVNLEAWTLGAVAGERVYVFPRLTLAKEVPVTIYTVAGDDSPQSLHWGLDAALWGESDTIIELRDAEGDLIATYAAP